MPFKHIFRFTKIKFIPAKGEGEDKKNLFEFSYDIIKGHNASGEEIRESLTIKSHDEPVETFSDALQGLKPYIADYCELPGNYASRIQVRGASIAWGEHEDGRKVPGVIITGVMRYKKSNGVLVLNTPFKQSEFLKDGGGDESKLMGKECFEVVDLLFKEAERYISGERLKMEIDFNDETISSQKEKIHELKSAQKN